MKVCVCNNISDKQVKDHLKAGGTIDQFLKQFCSKGCQICQKNLKEFLLTVY